LPTVSGNNEQEKGACHIVSATKSEMRGCEGREGGRGGGKE
jgi:hypothetical protein